MKRFIAMILLASVTLVQAQTMGRLPGVLFPSDRGTRNSANLQAQITAVSTVPYTFVLDRGTWNITANLSIPSTISVKLLPGAVFNIASGVNLEILGGFEAPVAEVFTGTGTASGPAVFPYRAPEWGDLVQYDIGEGYLIAAEDVSIYGTNVTVDGTNWTYIVDEDEVAVTNVQQAFDVSDLLFVDLYGSISNILSRMEDFATIEQVYEILSGLGLADYEIFNYTTPEAYFGAVTRSPVNADMQSWTVPATLGTNQIINVHLWGAGGAYGTGGYTYGELVVVDPGSFDEANASHVTTGMVLRVQVGSAYGRAAVWRDATANFNSYTSELLVAGGAGGVYDLNDTPAGLGTELGEGGGTNGINGRTAYVSWNGGGYGGGGGSQISGGAGGDGISDEGVDSIATGPAGTRVWGGRATYYLYRTASLIGGDGYFGGGGGGIAFYTSTNGEDVSNHGAGGGGSGYIQSGITGSTTSSSGSAPAGTAEGAYGSNAGYPGNPGRVVFGTIFGNLAE